jgi:hypothetical protein
MAKSSCRTRVRAVWRWQEWFMQAGVDGLLCDQTRPSRKPPLNNAVIARVPS